jgi:DNA repair protein RAD51
MIRNMDDKEVEHMANAIDIFTHIKIHLFKNSSLLHGEIYYPFKKEFFSYTITASGMSSENF